MARRATGNREPESRDNILSPQDSASDSRICDSASLPFSSERWQQWSLSGNSTPILPNACWKASIVGRMRNLLSTKAATLAAVTRATSACHPAGASAASECRDLLSRPSQPHRDTRCRSCGMTAITAFVLSRLRLQPTSCRRTADSGSTRERDWGTSRRSRTLAPIAPTDTCVHDFVPLRSCHSACFQGFRSSRAAVVPATATPHPPPRLRLPLSESRRAALSRWSSAATSRSPRRR